MSTSNYRYKIHDKLYDLSEFINIHPGGKDIFNALTSDTNITPMIYAYHKNPKNILALLPSYEIPTTDLVQIKYNTDYTYDMYCELKELVYTEMKRKTIPFYWPIREIIYNACMLALYLGVCAYCFIHGKDLSYGWIVLLSFIKVGYGALIFHETSHYAGFKNQVLNSCISQFIMSPMITAIDWKYEHNYLHHSFTNTEYDNDFEANKVFIRHSPTHTHYFNHHIQYLYVNLLYILTAFVKGPLTAIIRRRWNIVLFLSILYRLGFVHTFILYGLTGCLFASIAQLSHIQPECIQMNKEHKKDFLYNQVSSAMNYRTDDPFTRFISFGLDIQIEHHLFPNLPHSSLRRIQPIVRAFCNKKGISYIENPNILYNIYSYICYMYKMGNSTDKS